LASKNLNPVKSKRKKKEQKPVTPTFHDDSAILFKLKLLKAIPILN